MGKLWIKGDMTFLACLSFVDLNRQKNKGVFMVDICHRVLLMLQQRFTCILPPDQAAVWTAPAEPDDIMVIVITGVGVRA